MNLKTKKMHYEFIVNGSVALLISPENEMEEALLKQMMKQPNDLTEIRSQISVLNRRFNGGILIGKASKTTVIESLNEVADDNEKTV